MDTHREKARERIIGKREWDYESLQPLLSPLLACLSMTPAHTVPMKSLKLQLETSGRLRFHIYKLLSSNSYFQTLKIDRTPETLYVHTSLIIQYFHKHYSFRMTAYLNS